MIDRFHGLEVDWKAMELQRDGVRVLLKPKAFQLLEFLFVNRDRVVSKTEIFETVWRGRFVSDGALTTAVNDLRRALGDTSKQHEIIRTIYGQGLRFVAEVESEHRVVEAAQADGTTVSEAGLAAPETKPDPNAKVTVGLAVLALENLSADPELDRLGEVIAEDLITALSKFSQLSVVSRTTSFAVSHLSVPLREVAETLDVDYLVEGSFRPADDMMRVTVQLIDTARDQHIWASQFDWPTHATSHEQSTVIRVITGYVTDQVTRYEGQLSRSVPDEDLNAWQCYYRGITTKNTHNLSMRGKAIAFFERAIDLNPDFALARAVMSYVLTIPSLVVSKGELQPADPLQIQTDLDRAEKEALQSLQIDDRYPYAWVSLARRQNFLGNPKYGLRTLQNAVDLNPFQPVTLFVMGECFLSDGQPEEAVQACDKCIALGPSSVFYSLAMALKSCALVTLQSYEEAVQFSRDAQASPGGSANVYFGEICALGYLDRTDDAAEVIGRAQRTIPGFCAALFDRIYPINDNQTKEQMHEGFKRAGLA